MKIALVVTDLSNTRIGGIARVATEVGANLARLGHEIIAYVLARNGSEHPAEFRGIKLRYIQPFRTINPDYPVIGFSRRAFTRVCRDSETERFEVVHSFNLNTVGCLAQKHCFAERGLQLVVSNYETLEMDIRAKLKEFLSLPSAKTLTQVAFESLLALVYEWRYLRRAARVVTEDENTRQALRRLGVPDKRIRLIPSGVDVEAARAAQAPAIDLRQGRAGPVIGYLGRIDPRKGVQYLIAGMVRVRARYPGAVLFLAGGSRHGYDREIRGLIAYHGLEDCVRVLGRVPGDILPYYKLADVVVIPSLSEGIPITLGEAMAAGVPVVITKLPGVVAFVQPPDLVHWAEIADPVSLVQAIESALEDPERTTHVACALEFIRGYSWEAVARRHLAVYEEVTPRRG